MGALAGNGEALEWRGGQETLRVEPWGRDSMRVRGTVGQCIRDDLPGACCPPRPAGPVSR